MSKIVRVITVCSLQASILFNVALLSHVDVAKHSDVDLAQFSDADVALPSTSVLEPVSSWSALVENPGIFPYSSKDYQEKMSSYRINHGRFDSKKGYIESEVSINQIDKYKYEIDMLSSYASFIGNPVGKKVVVVFFDYLSPSFRESEADMREAVAHDTELKMIFRELPFEGNKGVISLAARAAIAASFQGKYFEMHDSLMSQTPPLNEDKIVEAARKAGLDVERMRADVLATEGPVTSILYDTWSVVSKPELGITAVPTFVARGAGILKGFGNNDRFANFTSKISPHQ